MKTFLSVQSQPIGSSSRRTCLDCSLPSIDWSVVTITGNKEHTGSETLKKHLLTYAKAPSARVATSVSREITHKASINLCAKTNMKGHNPICPLCNPISPLLKK